MKPNFIIISIYMDNISPLMLKNQQAIVEKFNPGYKHYQIKTVVDHGLTIDLIMNSCRTENHPYKIALGSPEGILFLDTDCIPLNNTAIDQIIQRANDGELVGHAQRSNHIKNDQHIFCAPSCLAISLKTYEKIEMPSARPTKRSDVAEEWTYYAQQNNVPIHFYMPVKYDAPPFRQTWETETEPFWRLADGMPNYGIGTEFDSGFWHMFQSFYPGQVERFVNKCKEIKGNDTIIIPLTE